MNNHSDYVFIDECRITAYFDEVSRQRLQGTYSGLQHTEFTSARPDLHSAELCRKAAAVLDYLTDTGTVAASFSYDSIAARLKENPPPRFLSLPDPATKTTTATPSLNDLYHDFAMWGTRLTYIPFVYVRIPATRIVLPLDALDQQPPSSLTVWAYFGHVDTRYGSQLENVWILEGLSNADPPIRSPKACQYAALTGLLVEHFSHFSRTALGNIPFVQDLGSMTFVDFQRHHSEMLDTLLFSPPDALLRALAIPVTPEPHTIDVLCRIRDHSSSSSAMGCQVYAQAVFVRIAA